MFTNLRSVNRSVAAGRLTRFWGYVSHDPKNHEKTNQKTKDLRPSFVSQLHHPLSQGSGQPPFLQQRLIAFYQVLHILSRNPLCCMRAPLPTANRKRGSCFDPRRDPRTEKPGRKQRRKAYLWVRKSRGKPALFSQNPVEGRPIESSHA